MIDSGHMQGFVTTSFNHREAPSMEISTISDFSGLGMEEPGFTNLWQMNSFDDLTLPQLAAAFGENVLHSFPHPTTNLRAIMEASPTCLVTPTKQLKPNSNFNNGCKSDHDMPNPQADFSPSVLSFINSNHMQMAKPKEEAMHSKSIGTVPSDLMVSQNIAFKTGRGGNRMNTKSSFSQSQDHIIAERKRREKLSQRFIALSAIVPGLKKTDKASVLGDAIRYLKQLQERVKTLEEQTRKRTIESVVVMKKTQVICTTDGDSSFNSDENFSKGSINEPLPEIEARFCDKNVLIRIHCEQRKGVLERTMAEIEKFHLTVTNSSVLTFGSSALDVTVIAQMDAEFSTSLKDLVKNLRSAFEMFM